MNFSCNCEANAKRSLAQERNMIERDAGSCSDSELSDVEDPDDLSFDDWNKRCLHVINLPTDTDSRKLKKYQALTALSKDFVTCAVTYGKTIISEMFLDEKLKSVTPSLVGGIAGGQKYLLRGILFKLADGQHQGILQHSYLVECNKLCYSDPPFVSPGLLIMLCSLLLLRRPLRLL
jgi:Clustered mitochondria